MVQTMSRAHFALMLLINAIWGFFWVMAKIALGHFPPMLFTALPYIMLLAVLFPYLQFNQGQIKERLLTALFLGTLVQGFMYAGLAISDASVITIAGNLGAPFSVILSVIFLREKIIWWRIIGIVLAFGGILVLSFDPAAFRYIAGLGLAVIGAFLGACGLLMQRQLKNVGLKELLAWISLVSIPIMLGMSAIFEHDQWHSIVTATPLQWSGVIYVAFISTLVADLAYWYLIRMNDISRIAPYCVLNPIFGVTLSVVFLGDVMTTNMLVGAAVALVGVFILSLPDKRSLALQIPPIEIDKQTLSEEKPTA